MKNNHFEKIGQHSALNPDFAILVPAAQNGGKRSMETLCEAFRPLVLSLINKARFAPIREEAESICYCEIVRCIQSYNGSEYSHFAGFVKKMVSLALQNALRKEYGTSLREQPVPEETLSLYAGAETREDEALDILRERETLKRLPANYHRLLAYYYWGGYSVSEIAEIFGVSHQAVSKMKQNALKQLRLLMENY